jgi:hypothetical protein
MALSSSQFDGAYESMANTPRVEPPLSLSAGTTGSAAGATAWRTRGLAGGRPMSLSKNTMGTTYRFDDDKKTSLPNSDKGMGRNE